MSADIKAGRLSGATLRENFADIAPPLNERQALIEAHRCYYCYDAPCISACPTGIDIPSFIKKIASGNLKGSAHDILSANIMGGICARACPTEVLCEDACVRNTQESKPIEIGALQRYATDWLFAQKMQLFERAAASGKSVAIVGSGPAGLACAHRLSMLGHAVTLFEARDKLGGLNEYGIAAYKTPEDFAQREVDYVLAIGGIETRTGVRLGTDISLNQLRSQYDALFLALGIEGVNALGAEDENLQGVLNAIEWIAQLRQASDLTRIPVGRRVVVIGGGNTAIDAAVQSKRLGAEDVTLVYRRGKEQMSATGHERDFAQENGVRIKYWAQPRRIIAANAHVSAVEFEYTRLDQRARLVAAGEIFIIEADMVFKAIGQKLVDSFQPGNAEILATKDGRIAVNDERQSSVRNVWAGGDCVYGNADLTVQAVQDGKLAAESIDRALRGGSGSPLAPPFEIR
jgi:dihydropyrimidine dehydrogenase (NAD+) subunit PreT